MTELNNHYRRTVALLMVNVHNEPLINSFVILTSPESPKEPNHDEIDHRSRCPRAR